MKILTGRFKGRVIPFRPHAGLRPTADKVRKALIDALAGWIEGKRVLDLYSGTGAMGMELLSAGASGALFVEKDLVRADRIRDWLSSAGMGREAEVWVRDACAAVERIIKTGERFDLVVIDPPYEEDPTRLWPVLERGLKAGSLLVYESRASRKILTPGGFEALRDKVYGDTRITIYRRMV